MGMFIPGIFCGEACGLGEADGIGMLCMCGVGEGTGFDPPADAGGSDFGVGDGIGIGCWCCPCAEASNNKTNREVSTTRASEVNTSCVSGWVKDAS